MEEKKNNGVPKVAVLYVEGTITDGWNDDGFSVGGNEIADRIREIRRDSQYKALVVRVNSPGGSVSGSDAILMEIKSEERWLAVVVSMGAVAPPVVLGSTECDHVCRQANHYRVDRRSQRPRPGRPLRIDGASSRRRNLRT